ncbi:MULTISPECIES: hypothetical protein [Bacillus cereus group]|nr:MULTISPECIES: hypothetical protein [Bacillus cereus group]MBJ8113132.1 hypothetical protein [Bacillus cereus group sp. N6]
MNHTKALCSKTQKYFLGGINKMLKYSPEIKMYAGYVCVDCGEEKNMYPPNKEPDSCENCSDTNFNFTGVFFWESFKFEKDGEEPYWIGEAWMNTAGIPICNFCQNRDFTPDYDVLEEWLVYIPNGEPFTFYCVCEFCQGKHGFQKVSRENLDKEVKGLLRQTEEIAEQHNDMLNAQIESDRLNYGEEYVLKHHFGYTDEDIKQENN